MNNLLTALYLTVFLTKYLKKRIKRTKKRYISSILRCKTGKSKIQMFWGWAGRKICEDNNIRDKEGGFIFRCQVSWPLSLPFYPWATLHLHWHMHVNSPAYNHETGTQSSFTLKRCRQEAVMEHCQNLAKNKKTNHQVSNTGESHL